METPKQIFEWVKRFGSEDDKKRYRVLYSYIQKLEKRNKELELMHDRHMAPQMFDKKSDKEILTQIQIEKTRRLAQEMAKGRGTPLRERLANMMNEGKHGSKEWLQTLKWNQLTEDQAMFLLNTIHEDVHK